MTTILLHIEGDEGQASRLAAACDLARACGGHLVCLSVMPYAAYALGDPAMGAFPVTTLIDAVEARRREERVAVEARLAREAVSWEWQAADGDSADRLVEFARLADVVVMSAGPFGRAAGLRLGITGDVAVRSPAPVLAVPEAMTRLDIAGPALLCWDGGQEAARTLRQAVPLLRLASAVTLLTVSEKDSPFPARAAAAYLARHGLSVDVLERDGGGASVEQVIRSVAVERGATWIVQGAYGHSRVRELLFGGVTRGLLADAPLPILLGH
ncbi:MAG: universal stress protein [Alphaproteobacteria bacterium]|nr:universal stress protein [Alphaproteobacteria bacterium]